MTHIFLGHFAHNVPPTVQKFKVTLEQNNSRSHLQRTQGKPYDSYIMTHNNL